ncbi:hypothetical protein CHS0354_039466 [Potamilus streckersoni]|uniref:Uncharacterized protein n=1 Tax=Potamilus streckersoni TaxID=2493646 RepID=A0AAE0S1U1_9BIVA|nr:hypothetical protein CHS0354_039466 [Potamilus streckersoni]
MCRKIKARRVMNHCNTTPSWTNLEPCQEMMDETGDHSRLLFEKNKHRPSVKSRVVCENFSNKPVEIKELSIDEFWDFLYSGEWEGGNSIRVLDGQLLRQLSHSIVFLRRRGKVVAHTTFAYAKQICPETRSCHKEKDKETITSVEETLLIELTNLGRLTKPQPNRPMDNSVHLMRVYQSPRKKKTKPKSQTIMDAKSASDNTSLHVPKNTNQRKAKSQMIVHSPGENNSDLSVLTKQEYQEESFLLSPPNYLELQRTDHSGKSKSLQDSTKGKMSPSNSATQERRPGRNDVKLPLLGKRKCDDCAISQAEYLEESTKPIKMHTEKLLPYQNNLEKSPGKYVVKLPRLVQKKNNDRATCLAERSDYSIKSTKSQDANKSEMLQMNEKANIESDKQKSNDDLDEALYLGSEVFPPEAYEVETAMMKLKIRKQELQKERELKKLLMKQSTEIKPCLPKLKPLDITNINLQLVHCPILNCETVPTLEEMIKIMKEDERVDPRYKNNKSKYKKRKIIRKYNLSRDTIMHVLKGIHRRHAVTLHSDPFGTIEDFVKKFSGMLRNKNNGDKDANDEADNKHTSSMKKWLAGAEVGKKAEAKSKCELASVVGAIRDSNVCKQHERLHTMTDQSKSLLDVQPKTLIAPLEHCLTLEVTKQISIAPEETSSIENVSKTVPLAPVKNATLTPLKCDSDLDSIKEMYNFSTECIPNPDILVTTSSGEIVMTMKTFRPLSASSRRGIKSVRSKESVDFNTLRNASETMNGERQFPKICMHDDNSEEPSILKYKSIDESDSEQKQLLIEVPNLNTFATDNPNALVDSVQKVRKKKLIQNGMPNFIDVVKKYSSMQEIFTNIPKVQHRMEDTMTKEKAKDIKVPGTQRNETNRLNIPNVSGSLRAFNFLSNSPIQNQTSRSTPSKLHFPASYTTEKFMLKFSQALEDFVVRREIVISNRNWKCSNSVTFTQKTVFTLRRI